MMTIATMKNYRIVTQMTSSEDSIQEYPIVILLCEREHRNSEAWAGITAFDIDGDQTGLSLADLYAQAENHETEGH